MAELDFLGNERYSYRKITEGMLLLPNYFSTLQDWGLFPTVPIDTTYVELDVEKFAINIIPSGTRGGTNPKASPGSRRSKVTKVLYYGLDDQLRADDLQNAIALANAGQFKKFDVELAKKLLKLKMQHDQTREYLQWTALAGKLMESDGQGELLDLFAFMGKTRYQMDLKLGNSSTDKPIYSAIAKYKDHLQLNMEGDIFTGVVIPVDRPLFDRIVNHPEIVDAHSQYPSAQEVLREDVSDAWVYKGVVFRVELGRATYNANDGSSITTQFVTPNEGLAIPTGTLQTFRNYAAPADFIDTVNDLGEEMYARTEIMKFNRGVDIHTQANILPINLRPQTVARVYSSN